MSDLEHGADGFELDGQRIEWPAGWQGGTFVHAAATGSTNDECMELLERGARAPTLVVADRQTQGRGRRGSRWITPDAGALLMSVGLWPPVAPADLPLLSPALAVGLAHAVNRIASGAALVKWPNDVFIGDKKIAGILLESRRVGDRTAVVAGIGVNLDVPAEWFAAQRLPAAGSLASAAGVRASRAVFLEHALPFVRDAIARIAARDVAGLQTELDRMSLLAGRNVVLAIGPDVVAGRVVRIDLERGLTLEIDGREETFAAAHVHVVEAS
jgi:BirA family transcriptional regulator, biotin operon repressor / biotin---[acetyl-CoA-carboxylase] ligase